MSFLSAAQWAQFDTEGFVILDNVASPTELIALNTRVDELMAGTVQHEGLMMQLDPNSEKALVAGAPIVATTTSDYLAAGTATSGQTEGWKGPSTAYRKIGEAHAGLELDPIYLAFMQKPLFKEICARVYGAHAGIAIYRAMVMAKPAGHDGGGTTLPWHQDGGDWWGLDRDPLCFLWLALSHATAANGAVEVVNGSHKNGLLSRLGHTLSEADIASICYGPDSKVTTVVLRPGQAFLAHNWLVHRSGINTTAEARRGFSANFVDARTAVIEPRLPNAGSIGVTGKSFPVLWGRRGE